MSHSRTLLANSTDMVDGRALRDTHVEAMRRRNRADGAEGRRKRRREGRHGGRDGLEFELEASIGAPLFDIRKENRVSHTSVGNVEDTKTFPSCGRHPLHAGQVTHMYNRYGIRYKNARYVQALS